METLNARDKRLLELVKRVLRKQLTAFVYSNGYPTRAVPQAVLESLTELVALELSTDKPVLKEPTP